MARIDMQGIAHSYIANPQSDEDYALKQLNVSWEDGGAYSLLGPSGCGKTTLLNIISGLVVPSEGRVLFDDKDVTKLSTQDRNIAQIFQFPVIYDTMSVHDNLAFPLRNRKVPEKEVRMRVAEVAELLELTSDLKRRASGLTADIKQIISLGRGLVRSDVAAVLLDEPLTVIDPHVKWLLRRRLKQIHEQLRMTMIFVTHDQTEALTFADQVVLIHNGVVVQHGPPEELFERPQHAFVGYFIGDPGINMLPCTINQGKLMISDCAFPVSEELTKKLPQVSGELALGIRPIYCSLTAEDTPGSFEAQVERVKNLGDYQLITARLAEHTFRARLSMDENISAGSHRRFRFPEENIQLFSNEIAVQ
ncbi:MAG: ABC transporter ATP-binding protein [Desulforhopalus sp.]